MRLQSNCCLRLAQRRADDFFLGGTFRNLDDLNGQLRQWLDTVANPRVHATTRRIVNEAFAEEKPALKPLLCCHTGDAPIRAARVERRHGQRGGNLDSVPDTTRRRVFDSTSSPMRFASSGRRARRLPCAARRTRPEAP